MAALAADSDRNYGELYLSDELLDAINDVEEIIFAVSNAEWKAGIEPSEEINLSAAAAAERWAGGMTWEQLARTGEALLQIAHLRSSHPRAAEVARATAEAILRDPVR
jgi:hypothetical protein